MEKVKIRFIINPISGGKNKGKVEKLIHKYLDQNRFEPTVSFTSGALDAIKLATEAIADGTAIIAAVGGDGTINEIAGVVAKYDKILAIIPFGSGNGLARFLKIPLNVQDAIQLINKQRICTIDAAWLNNRPFFNVAGVGFDAKISYLFSTGKTRGFATYLKTAYKEFIKYKSHEYRINIDGVEIKRVALAVSVANSSQYGNDVHIAPSASVTDGLLDVCIIRPFRLYELPLFAIGVMFKRKNNFITIIKGKEISLLNPDPAYIHVDGEPGSEDANINIRVNPKALRVIVHEKF